MPRLRFINLSAATCCITAILLNACLVATPTHEPLQVPGVVPIAPPPLYLNTGGLVWSPDSTRLAVTYSRTAMPDVWSSLPSLYQIWILDIRGGEMKLIMESSEQPLGVIAWLLDDRIAFNVPSYASGDLQAGTWLMRSDGSGPMEFFLERDVILWSPDGQRVAIYQFIRGSQTNTTSILVRDLESGVEQEVFRAEGNDMSLVILDWSPDGARILFLLNKTFLSNYDIYSLELVTGEVTKLTQGGYHGAASWSPDGELIVYPYREALGPDYPMAMYIISSSRKGKTWLILDDLGDASAALNCATEHECQAAQG